MSKRVTDRDRSKFIRFAKEYPEFQKLYDSWRAVRDQGYEARVKEHPLATKLHNLMLTRGWG
jgi:hypothetical protein